MKQFMIMVSLFSLLFLMSCGQTEVETTDTNMKDNIVTTGENNVVTTTEIPEKTIDPTNFLECEDMGGAIMESYPRQCRLGELHFTEEIEVNVDETPVNDSASKEELQQIFSDIESSMQNVDDNMQAMDIDDSELDSMDF